MKWFKDPSFRDRWRGAHPPTAPAADSAAPPVQPRVNDALLSGASTALNRLETELDRAELSKAEAELRLERAELLGNELRDHQVILDRLATAPDRSPRDEERVDMLCTRLSELLSTLTELERRATASTTLRDRLRELGDHNIQVAQLLRSAVEAGGHGEDEGRQLDALRSRYDWTTSRLAELHSSTMTIESSFEDLASWRELCSGLRQRGLEMAESLVGSEIVVEDEPSEPAAAGGEEQTAPPPRETRRRSQREERPAPPEPLPSIEMLEAPDLPVPELEMELPEVSVPDVDLIDKAAIENIFEAPAARERAQAEPVVEAGTASRRAARSTSRRPSPFTAAIDRDLFYPSSIHGPALEALAESLKRGHDVLCLFGDSGTGKTMVLKVLVEELRKSRTILFLRHLPTTVVELHRMILDELGGAEAKAEGQEGPGRLDELLLQEAKKRGSSPILILDEAQLLAPPVLDEVGRLASIEKHGFALIQVVLSGLPELEETIDGRFDDLDLRVTKAARLSPLSEDETQAYVHHRLEASGHRKSAFTAAALEVLYEASNGTPRLINTICQSCLVEASGEQRVGARRVQEVAAEVAGVGFGGLSNGATKADADGPKVAQEIGGNARRRADQNDVPTSKGAPELRLVQGAKSGSSGSR